MVKEKNFLISGSYRSRCAIVIKNTKRPFYTLHKTLLYCNPGNKRLSIILEMNCLKKRNCQNELRQKTYRKKFNFVKNYSDLSCGNNA